MKIIDQIEITEDNLLYSSIDEDGYYETNSLIYDDSTYYSPGHTVLVTDTGIHKRYECILAGIGKYPPDYTEDVADPAYWLDLGADNRWKMFDDVNDSQTESLIYYEPITVQISATDVDTFALINFESSLITVELRWGDTVVWSDDTFDTTVTNVVGSLATDYLFDSVYFNIAAANEDLYRAKVGRLVLGKVRTLGTSTYDPEFGIADYSVKEQDVFGNYYVVEGAFANRINCKFWLHTDTVSIVYDILASYRSTPIVWILSEDYSTTVVYGFYKDFSITVDYLNYSVCDISLEGVT